MAEKPVVHIGENSPEEVAYKLFTTISDVENRKLHGHMTGRADREYILRTYYECLQVVRGYEPG